VRTPHVPFDSQESDFSFQYKTLTLNLENKEYNLLRVGREMGD
jgi:hypothetical protein